MMAKIIKHGVKGVYIMESLISHILRWTTVFCLFFTTTALQAQQAYPIYVTPSLTPPYSLTLSDYSQPGSQRLVVTIQVRDVTVTNLPVRLHLKIETMTGVTIETIPTAPVMPIYLSGGEVSVLFGDDMREYFNINNLQFKGYSKDEYRRTGQLPEGFWRFTVEVRHFATGRLISNRGLAMAWIALGKPPLLKTPGDKAELGEIMGMPLTFSWIPQNVGIPGVSPQYTFEMWEMRVPGIPPAVVAASMPVFYSSTQMNTSLVVHPAALMLEPGLNYAWRVTASDVMGQVPFAQGGHSEVRSFIYQCRCDSVTDFRVERRGQDITFRWEPSENNSSYNIEIENPVSGWSKTDRVFDTKYETRSDPDKTYRARVQAICRGNEMNPGDFTTWRSITIPAVKTQQEICPDCQCDVPDIPAYELTNFTLRNDLQPGDTIVENYTRFVIASAKPVGNSTYEGQFWFLWEFYGKRILANYTNLQVNTDNQVVEYTWETVYDPKFLADVDAFKEYLDQLGDAVATLTSADTVKLDFTIPENPEYHYNSENSTITIIDGAGNPHTVELPKNDDGVEQLPMVVEDDAGSQYAIERNEAEAVTMIALADYQGSNYMFEHIVLMNNSLDSEDGNVETKGFTRNYFAANSETTLKLRTRTDYPNYGYQAQDVPCYWYVENEKRGESMSNEMTLSKGQGAYRIEARDASDSVLIHFTAVFIENPEIVFTTNQNYDGEYGFDNNRFDGPAQLNQYEELQGLDKYRIPFMSICVGETATIEAQLKMGTKDLTNEDLENLEVQFSAPYGITITKRGYWNLASSLGGLRVKLSDFQNNKLEIDVKATEILDRGYLSASVGKKEVGRVNMLTNKKLPASQLKLVKVIINDSIGKDIDIEEIKKEAEKLLNRKSFNQGFSQWEIVPTTYRIHIPLQQTDSLRYIYEALIAEYPQRGKEHIMFITTSKGENGWGMMLGKYSIINTNSDNSKTYIHELGHNFGFRELKDQFPALQYDTPNFMDYSGELRNMFWKWQWKDIYEFLIKQ